jgi:hypothetical protein
VHVYGRHNVFIKFETTEVLNNVQLVWCSKHYSKKLLKWNIDWELPVVETIFH